MKVILVNGGPHKNGCVNTALEEVAKTLEGEGIDTEIFWIGIKPIAGCIACKSCAKTGKCVFDDVVNEFVEKSSRGRWIYIWFPSTLCRSYRSNYFLYGPSILFCISRRQRG